ncbi:type 1 fimbrial protein [Salmonella enterica subsp. enterica serovar Newport]|nr:type 1 fimbrial protein [Salmonella enterica subsp. enterica serovar Newport]
MKTTLFTAGRIMACLMLISAGAFGGDHKKVSAVFHLHAKYRKVTCEPNLLIDRKIGDTTIDFGTFSDGDAEKTKSVELTLDCRNSIERPDTVKVGFKVINPATVDDSKTNRLYPSAPDRSQQKILYYDWIWGEKIGDTIKASGVSQGHVVLYNSEKVDLRPASAANVYEVVSLNSGTNELRFPLKITRNVDTYNIAQLTAGEYTAAVTVNVIYE